MQSFCLYYRCDARGYKKRAGICTVKKATKFKLNENPKKSLLEKYKMGIPCRSTILPKIIRTIEVIQERKSQVELKYCWEPCLDTQHHHTILNSNGNVVEVIKPRGNNIASHKMKPTVAPMVIRKTVFYGYGKKLILKCPSKIYYNEIIAWKNGSQVLDEIVLWKRSNHRVVIDISNRLVIQKTELWDSASFSCWQKQQHLATFKVVIVLQKLNAQNYKTYICTLGVCLTIALLLKVGIFVLKNRNKPI